MKVRMLTGPWLSMVLLLKGLLLMVLLLKGLLSIASCACPTLPLQLLVAWCPPLHCRGHCRARSRRTHRARSRQILRWMPVLPVLWALLVAP